MRSPLLGLMFACSMLFQGGMAQECVNGQCQMRTPLRTAVSKIIEAAPVRSAIQAVRPANWKVFNQSCSQCSGLPASYSQAIPYTAPFNYVQDCGTTQMMIEQQRYDSGYYVQPASSYSYSYVVPSATQSGEVTSLGFTEQSVSATSKFSDRVAFRRTFVKAVDKALKDGKINRWQALTIRVASRNDRIMNELQAALTQQAIEDGVATPNAIDWDGLLDFINNIDWESLIKFIEAIMKLFA